MAALLSDDRQTLEALVDKVKELLAAGLPLSIAIKQTIEGPLYQFAARHGLSQPITSEMVNLVRAADRRFCEALERELGGGAYEWAMLLWEAARPAEQNFTSSAAVA